MSISITENKDNSPLPFTLSELNQTLSQSNANPLECTSLRQLITKIALPFASYSDAGDKAQQSLLFKNIVRIFPKDSSNASDYTTLLRLFKQVQERLSAPKGPILLSASTPDGLMTVSPMLMIRDAVWTVQTTPSKRLLWLVGDMKGRTRIERLQLIASSLLFEQQMIKDVLLYRAFDVHTAALLDQLKTDRTQLYHQSTGLLALQYQSTDQFDDQTVFAVHLFGNVNAISELAPKIAKGNKEAMRSAQRLQEKFATLIQTGAAIEHRCLDLVETLDRYLERALCMYYLERLPPLISFLGKVQKSPILDMEERYPNTTVSCSALGNILLDLFGKRVQDRHLMSAISDNDPILLPWKTTIDDVIKAYLNTYSWQAAFYALAVAELYKETEGTKNIAYRQYLEPSDLFRLLPLQLPSVLLQSPSDCRKIVSQYLAEEAEVSDLKEDSPVPIYYPKAESRRKKKAHEKQFSLSQKIVPLTESKGVTVVEAPREQRVRVLPYAERVARWFQVDISEKLNPDIFPEYLDVSTHRLAVICHGFSQRVDEYLDFGIQEVWKNNTTGHSDTLRLIPMEISVDSEKWRGVATYCFGQDGVLYHRYFKRMESFKLLEKFGLRTFAETDFPELSRVRQLAQTGTKASISATEDSVVENDLIGTVDIRDSRLKATITLFRTRL